MEKLERINKYLSESGVCSRREVDELIETGRVEVNHQPARIGMQIDTEKDKVYVDGQLVDPNNKIKNAVSKEAIMAIEEQRPWWVDHNEMKQAREEAMKQNPKSKLLRNGRKNGKHESNGASKGNKTTKPVRRTMSDVKQDLIQAQAVKTRGHSAEEKQAKNIAVQAANKALQAKVAEREEKRRPKSFDEAVSKLSNPARSLKERRVEGVNPKAANLRGKKNWHGSMRRTRHK
ncbi:MAG: S4 domain-containing protein [Bacteroidales bacterium]|nr:S4 domain-containing protein [Bacteroidales bacterium]